MDCYKPEYFRVPRRRRYYEVLASLVRQERGWMDYHYEKYYK